MQLYSYQEPLFDDMNSVYCLVIALDSSLIAIKKFEDYKEENTFNNYIDTSLALGSVRTMLSYIINSNLCCGDNLITIKKLKKELVSFWNYSHSLTESQPTYINDEFYDIEFMKNVLDVVKKLLLFELNKRDFFNNLKKYYDNKSYMFKYMVEISHLQFLMTRKWGKPIFSNFLDFINQHVEKF